MAKRTPVPGVVLSAIRKARRAAIRARACEAGADVGSGEKIHAIEDAAADAAKAEAQALLVLRTWWGI